MLPGCSDNEGLTLGRRMPVLANLYRERRNSSGGRDGLIKRKSGKASEKSRHWSYGIIDRRLDERAVYTWFAITLVDVHDHGAIRSFRAIKDLQRLC